MTMDEAIRRIERAPEYTEDEVAEAIHVIAGDEIMAMVYTMSGDTMPPAAREGEHTQEESHGPRNDDPRARRCVECHHTGYDHLWFPHGRKRVGACRRGDCPCQGYLRSEAQGDA